MAYFISAALKQANACVPPRLRITETTRVGEVPS